MFLLVSALNAIVAYGLIRRATAANRFEAWLGGLVFAWAPAMIARTTGHFSLAAAAALPAFLWCLINAEETRSAKNAALVGLCMAWAALSDAYYGVYCLMIAVIYLAATLLRVRRAAKPAPRPWIWLVDVLIVCFGGLIAGLVLGRGGEFTLLGVPVHVRSLYNPVLILTALVTLRLFIWWRPHFDIPFDSDPSLIKVDRDRRTGVCRAAVARAVRPRRTHRRGTIREAVDLLAQQPARRRPAVVRDAEPAASDDALVHRRSPDRCGRRTSWNTPRRSASCR